MTRAKKNECHSSSHSSLNTPLIAVILSVFYGIERKSGGGSVQKPG